MNSEDQLRRRLENLEFLDEPAHGRTVSDLVTEGQRHLWRRRAVTWGGGVAMVTAVASGIVVALPGDQPGAPDAEIASSDIAVSTPAPSAEPTFPPVPDVTSPYPYPVTRDLLLETAVRHFDPEREHLPEESTGFTGGDRDIGTKLEWTNQGDAGMGMLFVAVTPPEAIEADEYVLEGFADLGAGVEFENYAERELPGTGETAWVVENIQTGGFGNLAIGVVYERPDGSLVGVGAYDTFGNNTTQGVSGIDIDLEQAAAFVTDPALGVADDDLAVSQQIDDLAEWFVAADEDEQRAFLEQLAEDPELFGNLLLEELSPLRDKAVEWRIGGCEPVGDGGSSCPVGSGA